MQNDTEKSLCPLTYWGGKQTLAGRIVKMMPPHSGYIEPFCGGAAVFWKKPPSEWEILNDSNAAIVNFYDQVKNNFKELEKRCATSLYSRHLYKLAGDIYKEPTSYKDVEWAWATWFLLNTSFNSIIGGSFSVSNDTEKPRRFAKKRDFFTKKVAARLRLVQLESKDALKIIKDRDSEETFFYCDPPYIGSDQGHYSGYTEANFEELLEVLGAIRGKFLLSSYPSPILEKAIKKYSWEFEQIKMSMNSGGANKKKIEVLTANYDIKERDVYLFDLPELSMS